MASRADVQYLCDLFLEKATDAQIEYICNKAPQEFDLEATRINLGGEAKVDPKKIVAAAWKSKKAFTEELCGRCREHRIPAFDVDGYTGWPIPDIMHIPKVYINCPNCGADKKAILQYWNRLNDTQQALAWLAWYEFANYHLQQSIRPRDWHPSMIWNVEDDNIHIGEPALTTEQHQWMKWVFDLSTKRDIRPIELSPIIEQTKQQMAVPF